MSFSVGIDFTTFKLSSVFSELTTGKDRRQENTSGSVNRKVNLEHLAKERKRGEGGVYYKMIFFQGRLLDKGRLLDRLR